MTTRAYALARRWTASILTAGALGTVALGLHLAQAQTAITSAQGVTQQAPQQQAPSGQEQRHHHGDGQENGGDDGLSSQAQSTGSQGSFQPVVPPGNSGTGGPQVRTHGS